MTTQQTVLLRVVFLTDRLFQKNVPSVKMKISSKENDVNDISADVSVTPACFFGHVSS